MYTFKDKETARMFNKTQMAKVIGLNPDTLRRVNWQWFKISRWYYLWVLWNK